VQYDVYSGNIKQKDLDLLITLMTIKYFFVLVHFNVMKLVADFSVNEAPLVSINNIVNGSFDEIIKYL
jgi:hypothetical protein